ncbi:MAG: OmpH family outer membrane protein [Alphaproteobacteria bacterium]|nr:OmpH family outer membrane protein [Alphaproteobacteria bacterium]
MSVRLARKIITSTILFLALALPLSTAHAADTSIGVVDVERILSESLAAKSLQTQVETQRKTFLSEIEKEENKLREEQKKIEEQRANMSKEELAQKAQEFETKRLEARKLLEKRKSSLDKAYAEAMGSLGQAVSDAVGKVAKDKGYDLVITKQNVIIGSTSLEITEQVMEELNKTISSVKLNVQ